jgi:hypothetical protein
MSVLELIFSLLPARAAPNPVLTLAAWRRQRRRIDSPRPLAHVLARPGIALHRGRRPGNHTDRKMP